MTRTVKTGKDSEGRLVVLQSRNGKFDVTRMASTRFHFIYMVKAVSEDAANACFSSLTIA